MIFVASGTNRREISSFRIYSARSETFRRQVGPQWAYVSESEFWELPILGRLFLSGSPGLAQALDP